MPLKHALARLEEDRRRETELRLSRVSSTSSNVVAAPSKQRTGAENHCSPGVLDQVATTNPPTSTSGDSDQEVVTLAKEIFPYGFSLADRIPVVADDPEDTRTSGLPRQLSKLSGQLSSSVLGDRLEHGDLKCVMVKGDEDDDSDADEEEILLKKAKGGKRNTVCWVVAAVSLVVVILSSAVFVAIAIAKNDDSGKQSLFRRGMRSGPRRSVERLTRIGV